VLPGCWQRGGGGEVRGRARGKHVSLPASTSGASALAGAATATEIASAHRIWRILLGWDTRFFICSQYTCLLNFPAKKICAPPKKNNLSTIS
jgi:hypothetical protein